MNLKTDNYLFFSLNEDIKTYRFLQSREEVDLRKDHINVPGSFSQMNFFSNTKTEIYTRKQRKFFEVIAKIGGFSSGIIFASAILYIYSENLILWHCIFTLISSNEIKKIVGLFEENINNEAIKTKIVHINNLDKQEENKSNSELSNIHVPSKLNINRQNIKNNYKN